MLNNLFNLWTDMHWVDKCFLVFIIIVVIAAIKIVLDNIKSNPKKKLDFIVDAQKNGCMSVAKLTCLTTHGNGMPEHYQAEYMYFVDGKRYFVTYQMVYKLDMDDRKSKANADMLLLQLKPSLILFYDKDDPSKVLSKNEVFTSRRGIHQIPTPKDNVWRNTQVDWRDPICLVKY